MKTPAISVCIPAYKQPEMLRRCLESISIQTFKDFEVIITDDSPNPEVQEVAAAYASTLNITYIHNSPALGSPENWNEALRSATGQYVKMIHHDDWLAAPDTLEKMYNALEAHPDCDFAFCRAVLEYADGRTHLLPLQLQHLERVQREPEYILLVLPISTPSVTLFRNKQYTYDRRMKWLVDLDAYIQALYRNPKVICVNEPLVRIGMHDEQITQSCENNRDVDVKEHILLLSKLKKETLARWQYYDYFWRLLRKYNIRSREEIDTLAAGYPVAQALYRMAAAQRVLPQSLWRNGILSKTGMTLSWLTYLLSSKKP